MPDESRTEDEGRQERDDWLARYLGPGWSAGGDGIYYPPAPATHHDAADEVAEPELDDALRDRLPTDEDSTGAVDTPVEAPPARRGFWRR